MRYGPAAVFQVGDRADSIAVGQIPIELYWELSDLKERKIPVCAGKPVAGADLRIVNPDGDIDDKLPNGESGEILLRGQRWPRAT